jgi:hypothetical protein
MKTEEKRLMTAPISKIVKNDWFRFMNTSPSFIGADEMRRLQVELEAERKESRKRHITLFKRFALVLAVLVAVSIIFVLTAHKTYASWVPLRVDGNQEKQDKVAWAWQISPDPNWIMTIERESGFDNAISPTGDYGECQLNYKYHKAFINSPEFKDWRIRILYCAEVYSRDNGKSFSGFFVRNTVKNRFTWFNN